MRKSGKKNFKAKEEIKDFLINQQIRSPRLKVITEDGEMLGEMSTAEALSKALEAGLDLVEVSPKADPPVARIMDYGRHRYQTEKIIQRQKAKQKKVETKGLRLSLRISQHDKDVRLSQAKKFLGKGDKLRIELILRGRERQMKYMAREIINGFIAELEKEMPIAIEQPISFMGNRFSIIVLTK
ncbi:MAG: translation initiation factor IF-3 [bacterium]